MKKFDKERLLLAVAAPVLAVIAALIVTSLVLLAPPATPEPFGAFNVMLDYGPTDQPGLTSCSNKATTYLAGLAVAIGFRMNLFDIGVDGQYRLGAFFAAASRQRAGPAGRPPDPADHHHRDDRRRDGRPRRPAEGYPRRQRGHPTTMLNAIATAIVGFFLGQGHLGHLDEADTARIATTPIPSPRTSSRSQSTDPVYGFIVIAVLAGVAYWFTLSRTHFGFDLRSRRQSETAADASGVDVKRMVLAGVGFFRRDGRSHRHAGTAQRRVHVQHRIPMASVSPALFGRNNPVGVGLGAILWAFLDIANRLEFEGYDKEIVGIMSSSSCA